MLHNPDGKGVLSLYEVNACLREAGKELTDQEIKGISSYLRTKMAIAMLERLVDECVLTFTRKAKKLGQRVD